MPGPVLRASQIMLFGLSQLREVKAQIQTQVWPYILHTVTLGPRLLSSPSDLPSVPTGSQHSPSQECCFLDNDRSNSESVRTSTGFSESWVAFPKPTKDEAVTPCVQTWESCPCKPKQQINKHPGSTLGQAKSIPGQWLSSWGKRKKVLCWL